jgi:acyl carrier protein
MSVMDSGNRPVDVERVVAIIRRDLMVGSDVALTGDTPLFGGELDLDSLDALLLMQSLEREFGFRMPTEAFGPAVFQNARTLARFVEDHRNGAVSPG